ncbi:MAG TPA: TetR/AcrR family transcriptional regulator, partial [Amycolatopsis sp.]|nr:TetR/AcrR family transcriptional regulator [Amycolatopsis sp.]
YLEFARTHPDAYRIVHRAASTADSEIRDIRDAGMAANADRILSALIELTTVTEATRLAVHGWLTFVSSVILDWLDHQTVTQDELRDMCVRTLFAAVEINQ